MIGIKIKKPFTLSFFRNLYFIFATMMIEYKFDNLTSAYTPSKKPCSAFTMFVSYT